MTTKYHIIVGGRIGFLEMMGEGSIMIMSFVSLAMNIYWCGLTSLLFAFFSIMHVLQQKYNMISINL
jgi:hypothetical protein